MSIRQMIKDRPRVQEVDRLSKYLGLPTILGQSKTSIFACMKDGVWKKIQGWKERLLSRASKEVLIKSIIQVIPTYMMSIFRIPDSILDDTLYDGAFLVGIFRGK